MWTPIIKMAIQSRIVRDSEHKIDTFANGKWDGRIFQNGKTGRKVGTHKRLWYNTMNVITVLHKCCAHVDEFCDFVTSTNIIKFFDEFCKFVA